MFKFNYLKKQTMKTLIFVGLFLASLVILFVMYILKIAFMILLKFVVPALALATILYFLFRYLLKKDKTIKK